MIFSSFSFQNDRIKEIPRKSYSIPYKLKVIAYSKHHTRRETCDLFDIYTSMLCRWIQQESLLQQSITTSYHTNRRLGTPGRYPIYYRNKTEDQLYEWILHQRRECT